MCVLRRDRNKEWMMTPEQRTREIREIKWLVDELETEAATQHGEIECLRMLLATLENWSEKTRIVEQRCIRLAPSEFQGEGADGDA